MTHSPRKRKKKKKKGTVRNVVFLSFMVLLLNSCYGSRLQFGVGTTNPDSSRSRLSTATDFEGGGKHGDAVSEVTNFEGASIGSEQTFWVAIEFDLTPTTVTFSDETLLAMNRASFLPLQVVGRDVQPPAEPLEEKEEPPEPKEETSSTEELVIKEARGWVQEFGPWGAGFLILCLGAFLIAKNYSFSLRKKVKEDKK